MDATIHRVAILIVSCYLLAVQSIFIVLSRRRRLEGKHIVDFIDDSVLPEVPIDNSAVTHTMSRTLGFDNDLSPPQLLAAEALGT